MSSTKPGAENKPLLSPTASACLGDHYPVAGHALPRRIAVLAPCLLLLVAVEIGGTLVGVPMSQIQEGILCRQRYPDVLDASDDVRCKGEHVQGALSALQGWELALSLIPGILTAIPYGIAADRLDRKPVLALALLGLCLVQAFDAVVCGFPHLFPVRLVWLGAMCSLIGGGRFVYSAMVFTVANDMSTEATRPTIFFYLSAVPMACELVSMPLVHVAVNRGPWFSVSAGLACLWTSVVMVWFCPETRRLELSEHGGRDAEQALKGVTPDALWPRLVTLREQVSRVYQALFLDNRRLVTLFASLLLATGGRYASTILMQFTTRRFGWSWSQAGTLSSVSTLANLVLVAAVLPLLSHALRCRTRLDAATTDLWVARASVLALVIGSLGIGLSFTSPVLMGSLLVYGLGCGHGAAMRGLLSQVAGHEDVGALFAAMGVVESVGVLVAGPLLAAVFRVGLGWGAAWTGLPFFAAAIVLAVAGIVLGRVQLREREKGEGEDGEDETWAVRLV